MNTKTTRIWLALFSERVALASWVCSMALGLTFSGVGYAQYLTRASTRTGGAPIATTGSFGESTIWYSALSGDGRWLVYTEILSWNSYADRNVGHLHDLRTGTDIVFTVSPFTDDPFRVEQLSISADGRRVCFLSDSDQIVFGDYNNTSDVFVYDTELGTFERVSVPSGGGDAWGYSDSPVISADGSVVVFESIAPNLVPNDTNGYMDVFLHEIDTGLTEIVNVSTSGAMPTYTPFYCAPSHYCAWAGGSSVSDDGRFVAFGTLADNLANGADYYGIIDVFVRDRWTGMTTLVSAGMNGAPSIKDSFAPSISGDGRYVVFRSESDNLVPGDLDQADVFLWDGATGSLSLVTRGLGGAPANGNSYDPSISTDGNSIGFYSIASNLVPNDSNAYNDVFVVDRASGVIRIVSQSTTGVHGSWEGGWSPMAFSQDGSRLAFTSNGAGLIAGDDINTIDVLLRDERVQSQPLTSYCAAKTNSLGCVPRMTTSGIPSFTMPLAFFVVAHTERSHHSGVMFWSLAQANQPLHGGTLCVAPPFVRTTMQDSGGTTGADDCTGAYSFLFSPGYAAAHGLGPGDTFYAQYWSRDAGALVHTDALAITLAP
jgi:Tol biopolymer transport system component